LCRDVDAGVLVMYTKVCLQSRNFRLFLLVFNSWGCVFVRNGVVWRIHFILFLSCFLLLLLLCISHIPIAVISPKILYISRPHRYARHMVYCYRCSLVCLSVCWIQPWVTQKRINRSRCRLGYVRLGAGSPERKGQCWKCPISLLSI